MGYLKREYRFSYVDKGGKRENLGDDRPGGCFEKNLIFS